MLPDTVRPARVYLCLEITAHQITLVLSDNGQGFDLRAASPIRKELDEQENAKWQPFFPFTNKKIGGYLSNTG